MKYKVHNGVYTPVRETDTYTLVDKIAMVSLALIVWGGVVALLARGGF